MFEPVALLPFAWKVHESSRPVPHSAPYCGSRDGDIPFVQKSGSSASGKTRAWCSSDIQRMRRVQQHRSAAIVSAYYNRQIV
jgi:hypothetical protein